MREEEFIMIQLLDPKQIRQVPTLALARGEDEEALACPHCEAFRPDPQLDGNVRLDPEIHLPSPGMDVDIAYFYNGNSTINGPFGYGRTLSTNLTAQASGSPAIVTLTRGSGAVVSFQDNGSGTFV